MNVSNYRLINRRLCVELNKFLIVDFPSSCIVVKCIVIIILWAIKKLIHSHSYKTMYLSQLWWISFLFLKIKLKHNDPFVRLDNQHVVIFAIHLPSLKWTIFLYFMNRHFLSHYCSFESYRPPIVQTLDSAIHQIDHYPIDKYSGNQLHFPMNKNLSIYLFEQLAAVLR